MSARQSSKSGAYDGDPTKTGGHAGGAARGQTAAVSALRLAPTVSLAGPRRRRKAASGDRGRAPALPLLPGAGVLVRVSVDPTGRKCQGGVALLGRNRAGGMHGVHRTSLVDDRAYHPGELTVAITSRIPAPKRSAFFSPIPEISHSAPIERGAREAMSSSVESWRMT